MFPDTDFSTRKKGVPVATSLNTQRRVSYQYMGSWPLSVINVTYPAWKERIANQEAGNIN